MKEYWINVYKNWFGDGVWLGDFWTNLDQAMLADVNKIAIYRIHVKLK